MALYALIGLASLLAKRGNKEYALEMTLIISNHPATSHDTRNRAAQLLAELESQLTQEQVEATQTRARTKSIETVVTEILN